MKRRDNDVVTGLSRGGTLRTKTICRGGPRSYSKGFVPSPYRGGVFDRLKDLPCLSMIGRKDRTEGGVARRT